MKRSNILLVCLLLIMTSVMPVFAQQDADTPVTGDAASPALQIVRNFLENRDPNLLAEDVELVNQSIAYAEPTIGRDRVAPGNGIFFAGTFTDVTIEPQNYIVAGNTVVAEFVYTGLHSGLYNGAEATNRTVSMPIAGIFQVENETITHIELYYDTATLESQLGYYTPAYGPAGVGTADDTAVGDDMVDTLNVDDITGDPGAYMDNTVTVRGDIQEILNQSEFILADQDLIDLDQEYALVIPQKPEEMNFVPVQGVDVNVTGTVRQYAITDIESELGRDLDDNIFNDLDYENLYVILATSVTPNEDVDNLQALFDDPTPFIGETITISANVGERVSPEAVFLIRDRFLAADPRVLAVDVTTDQENVSFDTLEEGQRVHVVGEIQNFVLADVEQNYGLDLDDGAFADYENVPVILVETITLQ